MMLFKRVLSAGRNEDDGCQFVEEAVMRLCTFHPFVHYST